MTWLQSLVHRSTATWWADTHACTQNTHNCHIQNCNSNTGMVGVGEIVVEARKDAFALIFKLHKE